MRNLLPKAVICLPAFLAFAQIALAESLTPEEIAIHSVQSQNVQEFAEKFKQFTDFDLTNRIFAKMMVWAASAAVLVDQAEAQNANPTIHNPYHCSSDNCYEQWAYPVTENGFGLEKNGQITKLVTTSNSGRPEAIQYCYGFNGVIACMSDIENGKKLKHFYWFGLKKLGTGIFAQLYWIEDKDVIAP